VDGRLYRLAKAFWRGSYERSMPLANSLAFDTDRMMAMVEEIMGTIAAQGNAVIVGRGAPFFLRQRDDTFRVFTYAPRDEKFVACWPWARVRKTRRPGRERRQGAMAYIKHYFNATADAQPLSPDDQHGSRG